MPAIKVRSDYEQLNQIAATFDCEAERTQKSIALLRKRMQTLEGGDWVGKGATKFYTEMNGQVLPAIARLGAALSRAANTTRKINELMQQTESESAVLFRVVGSETGAISSLPDAASPTSSMLRPETLAASLPWGNKVRLFDDILATDATGKTPVTLGDGDTIGGGSQSASDSGFAFVPTAEQVLEFATKWGRNASPFKIAWTYLKLNWEGINYWRDVSKAAKAGRDLQKRVNGLERGAHVLKQATDELTSADAQLPGYPLLSGDKAGHATVTPAELNYVDKYYNTAALIANDASSVRIELDKAIEGWDIAVEQANNTKDFTRQSAWEAITDLNLRFNKEGGDFRSYLVEARDRAAQVEQSARMKQYHAAHILGKWTPDWYEPPSPFFEKV